MTKERLLALLRPHGQEHLLAFWDRLDPQRQRALAAEIETIDFDLLRRLFAQRDRQSGVRELLDRAEPPPAIRLSRHSPFPLGEGPGVRADITGNSAHCPHPNPLPKGEGTITETAAKREVARRRGADALRAGRIGAVLVAGGQGTRLGFDRPKGMFPIGPLSGKSLFQIHVEKIVAAARRYGARIPLYLMTGPATHDGTAAFFAEHGRFGLPAEDLTIFCQGTMPAVDAETGRVLLEDRGRIALSPDGHGGLAAALHRGGWLDDMRRRGIEHLFYFQVDNPLVDVCSPEMIGRHLLAGSEMTTQVVAKCDPLERVGNVVQADGRLHVVEYSDLPDEAARRRNPDGSLSIWAGSIAVHVIAAELLRRAAEPPDALPFHTARKAVPYVGPAGRRVEPAGPNAVKFERFIFDLMPQACNAIVVEVDRLRAFAPLKNAAGAAQDSPEHVRGLMTAMHREWLRRAGATVADDVPVEISPLFALDAEELAEKIHPDMRITEPTYFQ